MDCLTLEQNTRGAKGECPKCYADGAAALISGLVTLTGPAIAPATAEDGFAEITATGQSKWPGLYVTGS